jgi:hypothetical protein
MKGKAMSELDDQDFAIRAPYVQKILELEASNKALLEKLSAIESDRARIAENLIQSIKLQREATATIESLNLRVERLVNALTEISTFPRYRMPADIAKQALSATDQDNQQWLREHDIRVLQKVASTLDGQLDVGDCQDAVQAIIHELRQPKKSPETDLDHEMRKA